MHISTSKDLPVLFRHMLNIIVCLPLFFPVNDLILVVFFIYFVAFKTNGNKLCSLELAIAILL